MKKQSFLQSTNNQLNTKKQKGLSNSFSYCLLTTCCLLLTAYCLPAQDLIQDWTKRYGTSAVFHHVIESTNGKVIAVGEIEQAGQGKNGIFIITDYETGRVLTEKTLGGRKDDVFNAVTQTREGQFVLVGQTESKGNGKQDAWAVLINEKGNVIGEQTYGTAGNDAFWDVVQHGDNVVTAGLQEDRKDGDIWLCTINSKTLAAGKDKMVGAGKLEIFKAMDILKDGTIVMTGNTGKLFRGDKLKGGIWIQSVRWDERRGWIPFSPKFINNQASEAAFDIVADATGGYAVAATKTENGKAEQIWVMMLDAFHTQVWSKTFGGADKDIPLGIAPTASGGFFVVGQSEFGRVGTKIKLLVLDENGQKEDELHLDMGRNDQQNEVCLLHDGTHLIAGVSNDNATLIKIKSPNSAKSLSDLDGIGRMDVVAMNFQLNTFNNTLRKGDVTYMSFWLTNNSSIDIQDVRVKVNPNSISQGVQVWDENFVGTLKAKEKKLVSIPVYGAANLEEGTSNLNLELRSQDVYLNNFTAEIQSEGAKKMQSLTFMQDMVEVGENNKGTLVLNVRNDKNTTVRNLEVAVNYPNGIVENGRPFQTIPSLAAGASKKMMFHFIVMPNQRGNELTIDCMLKENGKVTGNQRVPVRLGGGGLVSSNSSNVMATISTSILTFTNVETTGSETRLSSDKDKFEFTLKAITPGDVEPNDFKVYLNNAELDNSKFGETELKPLQKVSGNLFHHHLTGAVPLEIGDNIVEIKLEGSGPNQGKSETLIINYNPGKANLHVLAIGPAHGDLKYTGRDAAAFAQSFKSQEGRLYEKVFINELVTKERTTALEIKKALIDLKSRFQNQHSDRMIGQRDVVMVFISSHGTKDENGNFRLIPSDYDPSYGDLLTLDYKSEILDVLDEIDCKKLILIDACQSGAASKDVTLSQSLNNLNNAAPGVASIASCNAGQLSYEDDNWKHGAFTKAILEAFNNQNCVDAQGSFRASLDSEITLEELSKFLKRRVPDLVRKEKNAIQEPIMRSNELDRNMPVFYVN